MSRVVSETDPRYLRSRGKLRDAIWELASHGPVTEVSVAAVCRAAGVTRDTFYRHSASPAELLSDLVRERISEIVDDAIGDAARHPDVIANGTRHLLEHMAQHRDVYRNGLVPESGAPLRGVLEDTFRDTLAHGVEIAPQLLPQELRADPIGTDIAIAYAAAGAVGAVRVWLDDTGADPERGTALLLAASPQNWRGR